MIRQLPCFSGIYRLRINSEVHITSTLANKPARVPTVQNDGRAADYIFYAEWIEELRRKGMQASRKHDSRKHSYERLKYHTK